MKKILLFLLLSTIGMGCSSASTKATQYCDKTWQGRFDSWQACYDRKMAEHKYNTEPFRHIGDGLAKPSCTTWNGQTTCN